MSPEDRFRPAYHFSPARNWLNDPNGLVHHKGVYHVFFQHNPHDRVWGNMSWGHATSPDLVHWTECPLAIGFEADEGVFSGSVVVDARNTSGFGTRDNPPMVAMYTSAFTAASGREGIQAQSLAYSTDDAQTWTRYAGNPVLDLGSREFRDPKVFWYEPTRDWRVVIALPDQHKVAIYRSADLRQWSHQSDVGPFGATSGLWECPDLFPLQVDGNPRQVRWVLLVSLYPVGMDGISRTQYVVGEFDGTTFTVDGSAPGGGPTSVGRPGADWLDLGRDNYAGVTYDNLPIDERTLVGWMGNWLYAAETPTDPWRGQLTMPRRLSLVSTPDGLRLRQLPVDGVGAVTPVGAGSESANRVVAEGVWPTDLSAEVARLDLRIALGSALEAGVVLLRSADGAAGTRVGVRANGTLVVDRRTSGTVGFHPSFPSVQISSVRLVNGEALLMVYLDRSSVEVFADDGQRTVSDLVFPPVGATGVAVYVVGGTAAAVDVTANPIVL